MHVIRKIEHTKPTYYKHGFKNESCKVRVVLTFLNSRQMCNEHGEPATIVVIDQLVHPPKPPV